MNHEQMVRQFFLDVNKSRQSGHPVSFAPIVSATGIRYMLPASASHFIKFEKPMRDLLQAMEKDPKSADEVFFLPILIRIQDKKGNIKTRLLPDGLIEVVLPHQR